MAGFKYEKEGRLVAVPKGHKKYGWKREFPAPWKPIVMRGGGGK